MTTGRINQVAIAKTHCYAGPTRAGFLGTVLGLEALQRLQHSLGPTIDSVLAIGRETYGYRTTFCLAGRGTPLRVHLNHSISPDSPLGYYVDRLSTNICMPLTTKLASLASKVSPSRGRSSFLTSQ